MSSKENKILDITSLPVFGAKVILRKTVVHAVHIEVWYDQWDYKETRRFSIVNGDLSEADKRSDFWKRIAGNNVCSLSINYLFSNP